MREEPEPPHFILSISFFEKPIFGYGTSSWKDAEFRKLDLIGIHVGHFDLMFRTGLCGYLIILIFLTRILIKGYKVYRNTGNPIFFVFVINYLLINTTAIFIFFDFYGYLLVLFYLRMYSRLYTEKSAIIDEKPSI